MRTVVIICGFLHLIDATVYKGLRALRFIFRNNVEFLQKPTCHLSDLIASVFPEHYPIR